MDTSHPLGVKTVLLHGSEAPRIKNHLEMGFFEKIDQKYRIPHHWLIRTSNSRDFLTLPVTFGKGFSSSMNPTRHQSIMAAMQGSSLRS